MSITFHGDAISLEGSFPKAGDSAKDFTMCAAASLSDWTLSQQKGRLVFNIFPSIDTPVCALSTERFNKEAANISGVQVCCISKDTPFAFKRFFEEKQIGGPVIALSAFRNESFGKDYGVAISSGPLAGLYARAIVLVEDGKVTYSELVPELTNQPDYESVLARLR